MALKHFHKSWFLKFIKAACLIVAVVPTVVFAAAIYLPAIIITIIIAAATAAGALIGALSCIPAAIVSKKKAEN